MDYHTMLPAKERHNARILSSFSVQAPCGYPTPPHRGHFLRLTSPFDFTRLA